MKMIIGGAFQGKKAYAEAKFQGTKWKNGAEVSPDELFQCEGVIGFHEFIRKEMKAGNDTSILAEILIKKNPDIIIISDEVGYGIVPMDAFERAYREQVGRICTKLAAYSDEVVRVACGIGTVIKGD